jgi:hypothetical protein
MPVSRKKTSRAVTRSDIREALTDLDVRVEDMWQREELWRANHPDQGRPLICSGVGLIGRCTDTAAWLAERLNGKVYGYYHKDNPKAILGEGEFGHNFTVVDDRWLVDWWAKDTYQERDLYDLEEPSDQKLVSRLYGDPTAWEPISQGDLVELRASARDLTGI